MPTNEDRLMQELGAYERHRDELLGRALGKFVLIHGADVLEVYETKHDAIAAGYKTFGNAAFLVKQIVPVEIPQSFVPNHLAI